MKQTLPSKLLITTGFKSQGPEPSPTMASKLRKILTAKTSHTYCPPSPGASIFHRLHLVQFPLFKMDDNRPVHLMGDLKLLEGRTISDMSGQEAGSFQGRW